VKDRTLEDVWLNSPAFNAYRGQDWMMEPCTSCEKKSSCKGGCRCQALALAGKAEAADPVCDLSPFHGELAIIAASAGAEPMQPRPDWLKAPRPLHSLVKHDRGERGIVN
jgi:PqqA peptide cyclase